MRLMLRLIRAAVRAIMVWLAALAAGLAFTGVGLAAGLAVHRLR